MKLMTVNEYAKHIGKSIPLVYKQIRQEKVQTEVRFGRILVRVKEARNSKENKELVL
jgi:hypothetical protein